MKKGSRLSNHQRNLRLMARGRKPRERPSIPPSPSVVTVGASIKFDVNELDNFSREQVSAIFDGIAKVLSAGGEQELINPGTEPT